LPANAATSDMDAENDISVNLPQPDSQTSKDSSVYTEALRIPTAGMTKDKWQNDRWAHLRPERRKLRAPICHLSFRRASGETTAPERKSCSDGSGVVYLVGNDAKTSLLAPSSLPGDASFYFVHESRGDSPSGRGTEDSRRCRRVLRADRRGEALG